MQVMDDDRLGDAEAHRVARIERGERILEDVLDLLPQPPAFAELMAAMSRPSKRTVPAVGSMSCCSVRPMVDLPLPDSPTSASVSPG